MVAKTNKKLVYLLVSPQKQNNNAFAFIEQFFASVTVFKRIVVPENSLNSSLKQAEDADTVFVDFNLLRDEEIDNFSNAYRFVAILLEPLTYLNIASDKISWKNISRISSFSLVEKDKSEAIAWLTNIVFPDQTIALHSLCLDEATVFAEKIQKPQIVGDMLDKTISYFSENYKQLIGRLLDIRLISTAFIEEAFRQSKVKKISMPTVDFQIAFDAKHILLTFRFTKGNIDLDTLIAETITNKRRTWFQAWQVSSMLQATYFEKIGELEVRVSLSLLGTGDKLSSFVIVKGNIPTQRTSLVRPLIKYQFKLISEIAPIRQESLASRSTNAEAKTVNSMGSQLNYKLKSERLKKEIESLKRVIEKKNKILTETQEGIANIQKEASEKKAAALLEATQERGKATQAERKAKESESKAKHFKRKVDEYEEQKSQENSIEGKQDNATLQNELTKASSKVSQLESQVEIVKSREEKLRDENEKLRKMVNDLQVKSSSADAAERQSKKQQAEVTKKLEAAAKKDKMLNDERLEIMRIKSEVLEKDRQIKALGLKLGNLEKKLEQAADLKKKEVSAVERKLAHSKEMEHKLNNIIQELNKKLKDKGGGKAA